MDEKDPYRQMDSGEEGIRPEFLSGKNKASGVLSAAESAASAVVAAKTGNAGVASKAGSDAAKAGGDAAKAGGMAGGNGSAKNTLENGMKAAQNEETNPRRLYNRGGGESEKSEAEPNLSLPKGLKAAAPFAILLIGMVAIIALIVALPVLMIGALDYNLMKALGFTETIGILEKVGSYVTKEFLSDGKVPSEYASDLAAHGVEVGQVLANGDFIKTNTYIANADTRDDLVAAAGGFSYISDEEGELAMLYNGEVIRADDFVAAVESNPSLYAAYSEAADLDTKYYYGSDVSQVYKDMGLSRGNFNDWESSGNYKEDEAKYTEILNRVLDSKSAGIVVGGYYNDGELAKNPYGADLDYLDDAVEDEEDFDEGTYSKNVSNGGGEEISSEVSEKTREYVTEWGMTERVILGITVKFPVPNYSDNATERASELLNSALSAGEPYLASNAFIAIEEPVQRARVDGDGPVNEVMNTLTKGSSATYQNVSTGGMETKTKSILETANFRAAVSDSKYSPDEAANFARDRIIEVTDVVDDETINNTTVAANGKTKSSSVVRNGRNKEKKADEEVVSKANESLDLAISKDNSELFQTVVGANRAIEGGSFLSNTINMHVVGAMPSDAATVAAYHQETEEVLARKAEAERATKSPFDISSPNTFFGSIVHNMATAMLANYGSVGSALTAVRTTAASAGSAFATLSGSVTAEGSGKDFTSMSGRDCATVGTIKVEGDLYCTSHNTISTKYISYSKSDWESAIDMDTYKNEFVPQAMDRYATVGVKNTEVCTNWHNLNDSAWDKMFNAFLDMEGVYNPCNDAPEGIATGSEYAFNGEGGFDSELYAGYAVYDQVSSLLSGTKSETAKAREEYYTKYPKDDSEAGMIARISNLTRNEALTALAYADYLTVIADYNPAMRFDFTAPVVLKEKPILEKQSDDVALNLYAWYAKQTEYEDLRTRNFVI